MGLDTTHDCWHGPYGAFSRWRNAIAEAAGYEVGPTDHGTQYLLDWDQYEWCNFQGMWQEQPSDALLVLLVHSDCDGYLFPEHLSGVAQRLEEVLPKLSDEWTIQKTQQFIDGLHAASSQYGDEWLGEEVVGFH